MTPESSMLPVSKPIYRNIDGGGIKNILISHEEFKVLCYILSACQKEVIETKIIGLENSYQPFHVEIIACKNHSRAHFYVYELEITSWLVSAYDFYSRVVKDR